ncbi:hypothetical protein K227x_15440 [Rubripirellula lacrimiformis]|uniref:Uncharacterized protein n=1 Tax=Rubripirellula lacrimiformis TaxID=1930273 RepID=A0A517N7Q2_9BACT|nr:apolipoprotein acyltransferase [Rubripirellula lacrimiformis]QDT03162.1 hypothetical protein K227x_15440 [Rubripirellula lacrimiformis]
MNNEALIRKFHDHAALSPENPDDPDSLIGFFQTFRPDGKSLGPLLHDLDFGDPQIGPALAGRISELFQLAGDDRRPQGGRDAYFVVRNPQPLDPELASQWATQWLTNVRDLAISVGDSEVAMALDPLPSIRVLIGTPPKHPKDAAEKSNLLTMIQQNVAGLVEQLDAGPLPTTLRPAYYFIACDALLRDYLMWPFYEKASGHPDPFQPYFGLWQHGVKFRIFGDDQVDLYLPRTD